MQRDFSPNEPELMDLPEASPADLEHALLNLASLNHRFGSYRLVRRFLSSWLTPGHTYKILDVATGGADIPRLIADWARKHGASVQIDAIDASAATLRIASEQSTAYPEIRLLHADALSYSSPTTYDLVTCCLALHHFSDCDAVRLLHRCRSLSHRFVLISDLERSRLAQAGVWLATSLLYSCPMTRHDGRRSIRRAFSFHEMRSLAETAGWPHFGHARFPFFRQGLWLDEQNAGEIPETAFAHSTHSTASCPA